MTEEENDPCPEGIKINIGKAISASRLALGMTQEDLSKKAGVSRSLIAKIESYNIRNVSLGTLNSISKALSIPLFSLILGPMEWGRIISIALSHEILSKRLTDLSSRADSLAVMRLEVLSKSKSPEDRLIAINEIDDYAMHVLMPQASENAEMRKEIEDAIGTSRRVATAIGTQMLPNQPIINAVVVGLLAIPLNNTPAQGE